MGKNAIKEVLNHDYKNPEQLQSIAAVPRIIEESIYVTLKANTDDKVDAEKFDYYVCGLKIGGVDYTVRAVFVTPRDGTRYYDHKLTRIEKGKLIDSLFGTTPGFNQTTSLDNSGKDKKLLAILQEKVRETTEDLGENQSDDILFRDGDEVEYEKALARDTYERRMRSGLYQTQEALQDSMLAVKEAMLAILKAEGRKGMHVEDIAGFENAYLGENRLSSVNQAEAKAFERTLYNPMIEEVGRLAKTVRQRAELTDYMMAKHGLERNELMRRREKDKLIEEAMKGKKPKEPKPDEEDYDDKMAAYVKAMELLEEQVEAELGDELETLDGRDFAGLTALTGEDDVAAAEAEAQRMADDYEARHDTEELWNRVRAVTEATLNKTYESGLISKRTYEDILSMYDHYIPLRGFAETTGEEMYAYVNQRDGGFNAPIKTAKGRKSKADDPFANMKSMAESAIMQGNRNALVKQKFLNFVLNHPSDLVSVSRLWLQYDDITEEWTPVLPDNIEESDSAAEVERKMQEFEERMQQLAAGEPDKYKNTREAPDIPYRVVGQQDKRQHQVIVKRGGRDYVLTINGNPMLAQALNGKTNPDNRAAGAVHDTLELVGSVNRGLSMLYTTLQPDFVAGNFMLDLIYSNSIVWVKESPLYAARYNVNFAKLPIVRMKRLFAKYRKGTLDMNNKTHRLFSQFMKNGGETGFLRMADVEKNHKWVDKGIKAAGSRISPRNLFRRFGEWMGEIGRGIESRARFAAFVTSREMGRSVDRSIWDSKEISVNFNKKGAGDTFLGAKGQTFLGNTAAFTSGSGRALYIFWNAALQGTWGNFLKYGKRHPVKMTAMTAFWASLGLLVPVLASIGGGGGDGDGDDDDKDKDKDGKGKEYHGGYFDIPTHTRR